VIIDSEIASQIYCSLYKDVIICTYNLFLLSEHCHKFVVCFCPFIYHGLKVDTFFLLLLLTLLHCYEKESLAKLIAHLTSN